MAFVFITQRSPASGDREPTHDHHRREQCNENEHRDGANKKREWRDHDCIGEGENRSVPINELQWETKKPSEAVKMRFSFGDQQPS